MRHHSAAPRLRGSYTLFAILLLAPAIGRSDTISTQVTCSIPGQPTMVASGSCSQSGSLNTAQETLTATVTPQSSSSNYFIIQLNDSGKALANLNSDSSASSSATIDLSLQTAGPARAGYVEIVPTYSGDTEYASLSNLSFSIGYLQGSCTMMNGCLLSSPGVNYPNEPRLYSFNLGDPFSVDVSYSSLLDAGSEDYDADTSVNFALQFLFFESDGVTPVAVSPEPGSWSLIFGGLTAAGFLVRRRVGLGNRSKN